MPPLSDSPLQDMFEAQQFGEPPHSIEGGLPFHAGAPPSEEGPASRHPRQAYPLGSNMLPLVANFEQRLKYKYGQYFEGLPAPLDTFYDKVFYGKVDRLQNAIVPTNVLYQKTTRLKQISQNNIFVWDFVADNFFSFKRNMKIAADQGYINKYTSKIPEIAAVAGWENYGPMYERVQRALRSKIQRFFAMMDTRDLNKVTSFADFMAKVQDYFIRGSFAAPITLTGFVLSRAYNVRRSGMVVETASQSYSDDLGKYINYIEDPNFCYYVRSARKYGFYVDRNAPWRLFADPLSAPMLATLGAHGVTADTFFDTYYTKTYLLDLPLLKKAFLGIYNEFVAENKRIIDIVPGTIGCPAPIFKLNGYRNPVCEEHVEALGTEFWFAFYIFARSLDSGIRYTNTPALAREATNLANVYDYEKGLLYINNLFKPYLYDERLFKKRLRRRRSYVRVGAVEDGPIIPVGISPGGRY